jgi:hypothetical protein
MVDTTEARLSDKLRSGLAREWLQSAHAYGLLLSNGYDTDLVSLALVRTRLDECAMFARACASGTLDVECDDVTSKFHMTDELTLPRVLRGVNVNAIDTALIVARRTLASPPTDSNGTVRARLSQLLRVCRQLTVDAPLYMPRMFFDRLCTTSLKIDVQPELLKQNAALNPLRILPGDQVRRHLRFRCMITCR